MTENRESPKVVIGLLSHPFSDDNLGCVALAISNILLIDQAADLSGHSVEYRILVNEKQPHVSLDFTSSPYEYRVYSSSKQSLKHPIRLLRTSIFDDCDFVMNINGGDGYTDLYGFPRLLSESYMNLLAHRRGKGVVMAPQTIGPFHNRFSKSIGRAVLNRCGQIYSRDRWSTDLCHELGLRTDLQEVIDVAFALPFSKAGLFNGGSLRIGVNVSGLLYRGGYNGDNYFNLAFDYKTYVESLVARLIEDGYEPHLIPHVIASPNSVEDDYTAACQVHELHPDCVLAPKFADPIDAKSYIAEMDFFTGARMHSTIAALSSGVPVVPMGYSKKVAGLYETLGYPYFIDARESRWNADSAVEQTIDWIESRTTLLAAVERSSSVYLDRLDQYRAAIARYLGSTFLV